MRTIIWSTTKRRAFCTTTSTAPAERLAVEIATLKKNLKMTYKDFFVI